MPTFVSGVKLRAEGADAFVRALTQAQNSIDSFQKAAGRNVKFDLSSAGSTAAASLTRSFDTGLSAMGTITQGALLRVGAIATNTLVGAFAAAGRAASTAFADAISLEQSIANISALADGGVAAAGAIAQAVGSIATDPKLIANTESAALAFQQLEKQGLATADILGNATTDGVLRATVAFQNAAGQAGNLVELRTSAEVVGQALSLFGLEASEAGSLVDALAAVVTNSKFDILDLQYTLSNSAAAIGILGLSYEEISAAAIATGKSFSSARTQSTALESFLLRLSAPTDKAREALDLLGVSAYDQQGNFNGLISLQDQLSAAFQRGEFTAEAFNQLMVEAFGLTGASMASALAQGQDLNDALVTIGETSAAAIANIKVDTVAASFANLLDISADLGRRIVQPFVDQLAPAIQAASSLLGTLAGTFDFLGQRIAASLSPVINFVTQQFNTLAQTIAAVTGASISLPSLGAMPTASPAIGPAPRPITANSDASAANRAQAAQAQMQEQIGREQLEAARQVAKGGGALKSALLSIEDVLSASRVSDLDMRLSKEGLYQDSTDEFLRRLQAAAESGGSQFGETIEMARAALDKVGIAPAQDLLTLYEQTAAAWQSGELFADKENIALINKAAVEEKAASKKRAEEGRANVAAAFGGLVAGIADGASVGVGAAPVAYQAGLATGTEAQAQLQESLNTAINSQIQGVADGINGQGGNAFFNPADLYGKQAEQQQAQGGIFASLTAQLEPLQMGLGLVTGLFEGLNAIITGITDAIAGQDFTAAGAAVSSTLTTVLDALTGVTELADIGTTTANLSSFVQTLLDSAASFVDGLDGTAITESASNLLGAVVGAIADAFGNADLTGIAESAVGFLASVAGFVGEAFAGADLTTVTTEAATLISNIVGGVTSAITEFTGNLEAVDMTQVTTILGGAVESVTGFAADITAIDLTGVNEARTAIGEAIAGIATSIATAVEGLDGEAIGGDIAAFASNLVGLLADGIKAVPLEEIGVAASNLVGALAGTFREAFTVENLGTVGESIGGLVTGIIEQLTATLGNPAFGESLGAALGDLVAGIVQGAAGLLQGLSGGLEGEAVAGIGGAIGTFVQSFFEGLAGSLISADWSGVGQAVYEGISGAVSTLFSGAEGIADAIFAVPFNLGVGIANSIGGTDVSGEQALGSLTDFVGQTATALRGALETAFAQDAIYTADIGSGIGGAGLSLSSDISTAFAEDAIYPESLRAGLEGIATSISGAFTAIYDAIAGFFESLSSLLPSWLVGDSATTTPTADAVTPTDVTPVVQAATVMSSAAEQMNYAATTISNQAAQNLPAGAGNTLGDVEFLTTFTPDAEKALDTLTKAVVSNTNVYSASGTTDQSGGLINPETAAQLGVLTTTIPNAGNGFISSLSGATTSTNDFIGPMDEATAAAQGLADATDDQIDATNALAGSFNTLMDKSDTAAENLTNLNEALGDQSISQSLDAFVSALEDTINGMNKALDKLGTEAPPPTETAPTPPGSGPFAKGTRHYPGGRGLGGEEGPELYITPNGMAGLLGRGGPELFTAPVGTQIYPADITKSILSRGARGLGGSIFAAAGGAGSILLNPTPITLPPVTIPINENDGEVTRDEPVATINNGISSDLLAQFLQGLGQSGLTVPGFNPGQLAQQVSNAAGNTAKTTAQQIAELFTKPLGGGRYSAPQTQIINIDARSTQDNSVNNYNYNYGGLQMKSMRSTENLARDFRLLQAVEG